MMLFIKLFLAHLVSDFLINTSARRDSFAFLHIQALIYGLLAWLLVGDLHFWPLALMLSLSHWLIEITRVYASTESNRVRWFWTTQGLKMLILLGVWSYSLDFSIHTLPRFSDAFFILSTAVVFLSWPMSALIKSLISGLSQKIDPPNTSLANAGAWIGILERWLVFIFLIHGHWEPIGFLLAAKSVFRFGDLRDGHDRSLTEYVLIGTLISFGMAIVIALLVNTLITTG